MNSEPDLPVLYTKMLNISHEMLGAANRDDWDSLIVLEQERAAVVEVLQLSSGIIPDSQQERDVLIELIQEIQKCDASIRPMIISWMGELRTMFESAGNELKLGKQYGSF